MDHMCRTCMKENSEMNLIFEEHFIIEQQIALKDMLKHFASVEIEEGDGLPETVCNTCKKLIYDSYNFKILCEKSDITLRKSNDVQNQDPINTTIPKTHSKGASYNSNCLKDFWNKVEVESNSSDHITKNNHQTNNDVVLKWKHCKDTEKRSDETKLNQKIKDKEKVPCNICNKSFRYLSELERHKLTHSGDKPYLCNICGKSFTQMAYLKIHTFIHTGEKPYKCQLCKSRFSAPGTLMTHTRTHTGDRPHTCKICGKSFPQHGYLSTHMRTHTGEKPVECKVCNQQFSQKGSLIVHMRIHSGEKPYPCDVCGKSFAIRSTLVKHTRTHTGERPYTCKVCGQNFGQSGTLVNHLKVHLLKNI